MAAGFLLLTLAFALVLALAFVLTLPGVRAQALPQISATATVTVGSLSSSYKGFSAMGSSSLGLNQSFGSISPTTFTYDSTTFTYQNVTFDLGAQQFWVIVTPCPTSAQQAAFDSITPNSSAASPPGPFSFTNDFQNNDNANVCHLNLLTDNDVVLASNSGFNISNGSTVDFTLHLDYPSSTAQSDSHSLTVTNGSSGSGQGYSYTDAINLSPDADFGIISNIQFTYSSTTFTYYNLTYNTSSNKFRIVVSRPCSASAGLRYHFKSLTVNDGSSDTNRPETVFPIEAASTSTVSGKCFFVLETAAQTALTDVKTGFADTSSSVYLTLDDPPEGSHTLSITNGDNGPTYPDRGFSRLPSTSTLVQSSPFGSASPLAFTHLNAVYTHRSLTHDDTEDRFTMYIAPCPSSASVDDDFRSLTVNYQSTDTGRPETVIPFTDRARVTEASVCYLRLRAGRPASLTDVQTGFADADTEVRVTVVDYFTPLPTSPPPTPSARLINPVHEVNLVMVAGDVTTSDLGYRAASPGVTGVGSLTPGSFSFTGRTYTVSEIIWVDASDSIFVELGACDQSGFVLASGQFDGVEYTYETDNACNSNNRHSWGVTETVAVAPFGSGVSHNVALRIVPGPSSAVSPPDRFRAPGMTHRGASLKDTICFLPDSLGQGLCGPLMVFIPTLFAVGLMFSIGVRNPMWLAGAGVVVLAAMGAIVMPGPIMVIGFVVAAAGAVALVMLFKR